MGTLAAASGLSPRGGLTQSSLPSCIPDFSAWKAPLGPPDALFSLAHLWPRQMERALPGPHCVQSSRCHPPWGKQNQGGQARARVVGEERQVRERGLWVVEQMLIRGSRTACVSFRGSSRALGSQHPQGCLWDMVRSAGIKKTGKASSRHEKLNWVGDSKFSPRPSSRQRQATRCLCEDLFPQSVLLTREDGEVFVIGQGKRTEIFTG